MFYIFILYGIQQCATRYHLPVSPSTFTATSGNATASVIADAAVPVAVPAAVPSRLARGAGLYRWLASAWVEWRRVFLFGAMACVLLLSPSTYDAANRQTMARQIYFTSWRVLPWFIVLSGVVSWVLIRVVLVTALHYGLQRFALDLVVRVLVLEVIPLFAALYVALRNAVSSHDDVRGIFIPQDLDRLGGAETDRVRDELVPRVVATMVSVLTMVVISGLATLMLAY